MIRRRTAKPSPAASSTRPGRRWKNSTWCRPAPTAKRFEFFKDPAAATKGAEFVQESGPEREDLKIELFATLDAALPPDVVIATSSSGLLISRVSVKCKHPERCVIGHPFNPASPHSAGRGCRRPEDVAGSDRQGDAILSRHRQASDPHQEGSEGPCRQPPAGGAVARSRSSRRRRCCFRRRCRRGDRLWPRPALGADGAASDISSWPAAKAA